MFGRKRRSVWMASLLDAQGLSLFLAPMDRLRFEEQLVLALSLEFFDDPSPCEIHRSAVVLRAIEEIRAACAADVHLPLCALSPRVRVLLGAYPEAAGIRVWEAQK